MEGPAASDNVFTHEPLPDPAEYMRLLEVLDDNYSKTTKVRCRLTTWPIDSMPPYHAISYTWGDPKSNTHILMNDKTLEVRTNCEFALKQAYWYRKSRSYFYRKRKTPLNQKTRSKWYTKSRYFWLDALCIDQSNLKEKSKQVAMMGSIYKKATHVLACIGDHADDSLFLFQSLYGLTYYVVRPEDVLDRRRFALRFRMLHRHSTTHRVALALARLALRPYFTRMWILQELQLAQHLTILCGQHVLARDDALALFSGLIYNTQTVFNDFDRNSFTAGAVNTFFVGHRFLRRHVNHGFPHPACHGSWLDDLHKLVMTTVNMLGRTYRSVKGDVFGLLNNAVDKLQCRDPRDKAYGIISLIDWRDVPPLEPDYTQNDLEVAVKFIEAIMKMKIGETRGIYEPVPIWKYVILVVKLFDLKSESPGLLDALKARRRSKDDCAMGNCVTENCVTGNCEMETAKTAPARPKIGVEFIGWCLSSEDIDRNMARLRDLHASPPQYSDDEALYLPRWVRADDWVMQLRGHTPQDLWYPSPPLRLNSQYRPPPEPAYIPLLVAGKIDEGGQNSRIGYGFYSNLKGFRAPRFKQGWCTKVNVYFDIEDSIIFLSKMKQLYELGPEPKDWMVDLLNTDVSEQQTPEPSYALLPPPLPRRKEPVEPKPDIFEGLRRSRNTLGLGESYKVLFDTKTRRGWFVNDAVAALELLCAYLRNIPQTEPFDFSKLNYFEDKSSIRAFKVLGDEDNLRTPIPVVFKDVEERSGENQSLKDKAKVERKLIVDVLRDIYNILPKLDPLQPFPGDMDQYSLIQITVTVPKRRSVISKGWDFERLYRTSKAKTYTHVFDENPGWLEFAKEARAGILFGSDFGEMLLPREEDCCPHFKTLPKGQDYLAIGMDKIQHFIPQYSNTEEPGKWVARVSRKCAWERGVDPFGHIHGRSEHLEQVDHSCFPVQRLVEVSFYTFQEMTRKMSILKKRKGRLYFAQEINEMNGAIHYDINKLVYHGEFDIHNSEEVRNPGVVVFGKRPDIEKLKQLAETNSSEVQCRETAEERRNSHCSSEVVSSFSLAPNADTP